MEYHPGSCFSCYCSQRATEKQNVLMKSIKQKMEDNKEVARSKTFREMDQNIVKKSSKNKNQEANKSIPVKEENPVQKRGRGRPRKNYLDVKTQSSTTSTSKVNSLTLDSNLGLKNIRYRPIRPKPFPTAALLRHKLFETPVMLNMSTLTSNRVIVTVPNKDKTQNTALDNSSKTTASSNVIKSIISKESKTNERPVENASIQMNTGKSLHKATYLSKSNTISNSPNKSSIELFFESMAQTVVNLPMEIQAEIKMKICKLVTMAEMKYCESLKSQD